MRSALSPVLVVLAACSVASAQQSVNFTIDAHQNVNPISPWIYGVNNESLSGAYQNVTFSRVGGNRLTAYNWENNASNAGSDWYFQNDGLMSSSNTPGAGVANAISDAGAHNAGILLTIPTNGYVAADKNGGGDVRNSGANYLQTRFKQELPAKGSAFTLTPNTNDAYVYQDEFVNWVKTTYPYGQTDPNRPIWFTLDNEPDLWSSTHAEVHPLAATYAEIVQKTIDYSSAIKAVAPTTKVFGPANYGWQGYVNLQGAPDAGGRDFLDYYLQQMNQAGQTAGKRLLDALDVHWYPEAHGTNNIRITNSDSSSATVAARLQAPRSLWDPNYTESSWITQWSTYGPINLLPRLKAKIAANYPGTKLAISEYNYGGGSDISGALAEADVLGIFGRDGVFSANEWPSGSEPFVAGAFAMFRNFDGLNGTFGDTSVLASTSDVPDSSVYASLDSTNPNRMVLMAINKTNQPLTAHFELTTDVSGGHAYDLTSASSIPQDAGAITLIDSRHFDYTMPPYSANTLSLAVPEPATWCLLGTGGLPLVFWWLRRRSRPSVR